MANLPIKVQPGDLITSALMNALIDKCADFETRIASLEGGTVVGPPKIARPGPSETYRIGQELRIEGTGFGTPSDNIVFIDGSVQINVFKAGSTDSLLIITLPFVQNVPLGGRPVTLTVSNPRGFDTTTFTLAQPEVTMPTGTLTATLSESPNVPQILAGQSYTFAYGFQAATTADEVYQIVPSVNLGWSAVLVDGANNPIQPQEIPIQKPATPTVPTSATARIRVTVPGGVANGTVAQLSVTIRSKRNPTGLFRISDDTPITVNAAPPAADQVGISLLTVFTPATKVGNEIVIPPPAAQTTAFATFKVEVPTAGAYSFDNITFKNDPANLWSAAVIPNRQHIAMQPPQATVNISITVKAGAPAALMTLKATSDSNATVFGDIDQPVRLGP